MQNDQINPIGKWTFDADVTNVFDDMLTRSIPQYEIMRQACFDLACRYVKPNTDIVDLGASRGEAIARLVDRYGAHNRFVGIEVSQPMLDVLRQRFEGLISCRIMQVLDCDLRREFPPVQASVMLSILTIQFIPIEYRQKILRMIYKHLLPGGVLILVEKVLGATADLDEDFTEIYRHLKSHNGYTQEQIDRKALSLEGVLVPVTAAWNEDLLRQAGFTQVDCFWRFMNFAGWLAVKE